MSWIVFVFLVLYGAVRTGLWIRGQLRYLTLRHRLPPRPEPLALPAHLTLGLQRLVAECHRARALLVDALRAIDTVLIIDPDVPLGCVRDYRYRVAVLTAWSAAGESLRALEALDHGDLARLEALGCTLDRYRQALAALAAPFHEARRARPLEPFAVDRVRGACAAVEAIARELAVLEGRLGVAPASPYRS